jgi:hypothetical protein
MRISLEVPPPPPGSQAAAEETEDDVRALLASLIRRCQLERCSVLLRRDKERFCSDDHRIEFHNRARYRPAAV